MVESRLTDELVRDGKKLIEQLDRGDLQVKAATWLYLSESDTWRLTLGIQRLDTLGPREAYKKVQSALAKTKPSVLSLDDIGIADPKMQLFVLMRRVIATGSAIAGIRFTRNVIDGHMIEDAYVYRLPKAD